MLITTGNNEKCKIRSKGSRDLLFKFWDPLHMSRTGEARSFKFDMDIEHEKHGREKNAKLSQRGSGRGHVTYF